MSFDGRALVPPALNQYVEDLAFVVNSAPQVHPLGSDPDDHLIEMPAIARAPAPLPQPPRYHRPEFQHPAARSLIRDIQATLGKEFLHVAVAQREAQVQSDGVLDDDRQKAMPAIGNRRHDRSLRPGRYRGPARYLDNAAVPVPDRAADLCHSRDMTRQEKLVKDTMNLIGKLRRRRCVAGTSTEAPTMSAIINA